MPSEHPLITEMEVAVIRHDIRCRHRGIPTQPLFLGVALPDGWHWRDQNGQPYGPQALNYASHGVFQAVDGLPITERERLIAGVRSGDRIETVPVGTRIGF